MNLIAVLIHLAPDVSWTVMGDSYDDLIWPDTETPKPSEELCLDTWESIKAHVRREEINSARNAAYKERADQLFFKWQRGETSEKAWLDEVQRIREEFPFDD